MDVFFRIIWVYKMINISQKLHKIEFVCMHGILIKGYFWYHFPEVMSFFKSIQMDDYNIDT